MKDFQIGLIFILMVIVAITLIFSFSALYEIKKEEILQKELAQPANLNFTILQDPNCPDCFPVSEVIGQIKAQNVKAISEEVLSFDSAEGGELIEKFKIQKIPAFIVSGEIGKSEDLKSLLDRLGRYEDSVFIFDNPSPPYLDLKDQEIVGRVRLTMLVDKSCLECYDVTLHQSILAQLGISIFKDQVLDIGLKEGKVLVKNYNITALPTILLSQEASVYPELTSIWPQVGTIEPDGTFVFRQVQLMGTYKDLKSGKIIKPVEHD